ncbi:MULTISPECIES: FAD-dependent monooxygenase [unclassified Pseudomonas]|uniref:FAD-dependent monooxygenase n=1 Tax=unclassified Pseudomonas TaxID=196821 RepID=UPI0035BF4E93
MQNSSLYDVVIAGAGPVGLFLACELRLANVSVLVLEQSPASRSPLKVPPFGVRSLTIPSVEAFARRGLLHEIAKSQQDNGAKNQTMSPAPWMQQKHRQGGHFAGIQFSNDAIDESKWPYQLPESACTQVTTMAHIESVLSARALAMGSDIRYGCGVDGFSQSTEEVTVYAGSKVFRGRWLIGCDGGRSTVRKTGNFEFAGTEPEFTGYSVVIELADPCKLVAGRQYTPTGIYNFQPPGTLAMVDFDGGAFHRSSPITRAQVQAILRHISGVDVTVTALHLATTWTDRAYQATTYRSGRVLLAGDAAHIHSPLGGQGLNLGLGDAMNLGWKLAATVRGNAPEDLLNSYFAERHPQGAQVLDWSRAQVTLMRPSPSSRALASIIRDLMETPEAATYFAKRTWGASVRYELGGDHDLVGRSTPNFQFADGTKVNDLFRTGKGLFLDFDPRAPFQAIASGWRDQLDYVARGVQNTLGLTALMIRPDGIVAWACDGAAVPDEVTPAAERWFGRN